MRCCCFGGWANQQSKKEGTSLEVRSILDFLICHFAKQHMHFWLRIHMWQYEGEVRLQGLATAWSINQMLSFQGRLKSASHSDVRTKTPSDQCVLSLSLYVFFSVSPSLSLSPSARRSNKAVEILIFHFCFHTTFLCSAVYMLWNAVGVATYTASLATGHTQVIYNADICGRGVKELNRHLIPLGIFESNTFVS